MKRELENLVKELQQQDKEIQALFEKREAIAREAKENGLYNELWEMLFADGNPHITF